MSVHRDDLTRQNANTSPLLQLPAELRNAIYELVLGGHNIRICAGMFECERCRKRRTRDNRYPWKDESNTSTEDDPQWAEHGIHYPQHLLVITATRRAIHAETRLIPFESNTFKGWCVPLDTMLSSWLAPFQIAAVRSLDVTSVLDEFQATKFDGIARFKGLRHITTYWLYGPVLTANEKERKKVEEQNLRDNIVGVLRGHGVAAEVNLVKL